MPLTVIPVNVPNDVTFGWAGEVSAPANKPEKRVADIFPAEMLPVTPRFPLTFAPVPVTTNTLAFPADDSSILPFSIIDTLLVPLMM